MALFALPPPAIIRPILSNEFSAPQGTEALSMQAEAIEAKKRQEDWHHRLAGIAPLDDDDFEYRHVPLHIVGTMKIRYVSSNQRLTPRQIDWPYEET